MMARIIIFAVVAFLAGLIAIAIYPFVRMLFYG